MITDFFNSEQIQELGKNSFETAFIIKHLSEYFSNYGSHTLKLNNLTGVTVGDIDHSVPYADLPEGSLQSGGNGSIASMDYDDFVNIAIDSPENEASAGLLLKATFNASSAVLKRKMFSSVFGKIHGMAGHNLTVSSATDYETFITDMTSKLDDFDAPQLGRYAVLPSEACFGMVKDDVLDNRFEMGSNIDGYFGFYGNVAIFSGGKVSNEGGHVRMLGGVDLASNVIQAPTISRVMGSERRFNEKIQMRNVYGVGVSTPQWVAKATIA